MSYFFRNNPQRIQRKALTGTNAIEYALPAALIIVTIVTVVNSGTIQGMIAPWFRGTVNQNGTTVNSYGTSVMASSALQVQTGGPNTTAPNQGIIPPTDLGQEEVCFSSGLCINIPVIPGGSIVETTSTSGAWAMQIASIIQQIAEFIAEREGESPFTNALTALANKGHDMGYTMETLPSVGLINRSNETPIGLNAAGQQIINGMTSIGGLNGEFGVLAEVANTLLKEDPSISEAYPELKDLLNHEVNTVKTLATSMSLSPAKETSEGSAIEGLPAGSSGSNTESGSTENLAGGNNPPNINGLGNTPLNPGNDDPSPSGGENMSPQVDAEGVQSSSNIICALGGGGNCSN